MAEYRYLHQHRSHGHRQLPCISEYVVSYIHRVDALHNPIVKRKEPHFINFCKHQDH